MATKMYEFSKLLDNMPATQSELARISKVNTRSIIRMKNGNDVYRSTANKILKGLSEIYGQSFDLDNVTGISVYDR